MAAPKGFGPSISALTGRRVRPLHYGALKQKMELVPIVDCNNMASPCQVDSSYGNLFSRRLHMGSRDKSHRESKKPKKDSSKKVLPTTISPIYVPPVTVEVVKKGKKEKPEE